LFTLQRFSLQKYRSMIPQKKLMLASAAALCAILMVYAGKNENVETASPQTLPRVLVFAKTLGYRHASIADGLIAIQKLGRENNFLVDTTTNAAYFRDDSLKHYAAVVFLSTTGDVLNDEQQAAFERFIHTGGGFAGVHAAADTEYNWPWYNRLLGAYLLNHPRLQTAVVVVKDKNHPSTSMLPDRWQRFDEWYNYKSIMPDIRVLATLDETTYEGGVHGENHPISWYHAVGCGRSWYTGLGHTRESYRESLFLQHLLGGIQYAIGNGQACATLPVALADFTATLTHSKEVVLTWRSATEPNSDHFVAERSQNLHSFTVVGTVKANGFPSSYSLKDTAPVRGLTYYRLKQVDKNGVVQYSQNVSVSLPEGFKVLIFPNPSKGIVQVTTGARAGERVAVRVIDIAGKMVYSRQHQGPRFSVELSGLPSGSYVIRVGEEVKQLRLVK
jgi:type 1 glutamine amidotransferase